MTLVWCVQVHRFLTREPQPIANTEEPTPSTQVELIYTRVETTSKCISSNEYINELECEQIVT